MPDNAALNIVQTMLPRIMTTIVPQLSPFKSKLLAEGTGTFYLVLTVALCIAQPHIGMFAPLAIGFMLVTQVFSVAYISGSHVNPSVSLTIHLMKLMTFFDMICYFAAQTGASIAASLIASILINDGNALGAPAPQSDAFVDIWRAFLAEFLFTASLNLTILQVACSRQKDNNFYGLSIGLQIVASAYSVGAISGGAFNPAGATGLIIAKCVVGGNCNAMKHLWLYWAAPCASSVAAAAYFRLMNNDYDPEFAKGEEKPIESP